MKFRNKYKLKITPASEPSQIIYDNMKYNKCNVYLRRIFTFILSFVASLLSCSTSLVAATYRKSHLQNAAAADAQCPVLEDPLTELLEGESECSNDCLCSQLSAAQTYDQVELCGEYLKNMSISNALIGGSAVIIIVIKRCLGML